MPRHWHLHLQRQTIRRQSNRNHRSVLAHHRHSATFGTRFCRANDPRSRTRRRIWAMALRTHAAANPKRRHRIGLRRHRPIRLSTRHRYPTQIVYRRALARHCMGFCHFSTCIGAPIQIRKTARANLPQRCIAWR